MGYYQTLVRQHPRPDQDVKDAIREMLDHVRHYDGSAGGPLVLGGHGTDIVSLISWASDQQPTPELERETYRRLWAFNKDARSATLATVVVHRALIRREAELAMAIAKADALDPHMSLVVQTMGPREW